MAERGQQSHSTWSNKCKQRGKVTEKRRERRGRRWGDQWFSWEGRVFGWKATAYVLLGALTRHPGELPVPTVCSTNKRVHTHHHAPARSGDVINYHQNEHDSKQVCVHVQRGRVHVCVCLDVLWASRKKETIVHYEIKKSPLKHCKWKRQKMDQILGSSSESWVVTSRQNLTKPDVHTLACLAKEAHCCLAVVCFAVQILPLHQSCALWDLVFTNIICIFKYFTKVLSKLKINHTWTYLSSLSRLDSSLI